MLQAFKLITNTQQFIKAKHAKHEDAYKEE